MIGKRKRYEADAKIAANLKKERKVRHSIASFSRLADISPQQLQKYESGQDRLTLCMAHRVCRILGIELTRLLKGVKEKDLINKTENEK